ncbi:MAG TPA: hypothetical protein PK200_03070 [Spirochaetota bacterium]|nr:hypothetical protein [Spirochaetota bacterium]HQP48325.1 hypothetical protein [Spirochaetota bacterium]
MTSNYKDHFDSLYVNAIGDNEPSVELHVQYNEGELIDLDTGNSIELKNNAIITITTAEYNLIDNEAITIHTEKYERTIAQKGEDFIFGFRVKDGANYMIHEFKLRIEEDLKILWKGKKLAKLQPCQCSVYYPDNLQDSILQAKTLNSAFTLTSIKFRPDVSSHTCNVFKVFVDSNMVPLDERRKLQYVDDGLTTVVRVGSGELFR